MTIHRIDFAIDLLGPIARVCGAVARFAPRDRTVDGKPCPPSEVDDWSCLIGEFACGATGVWEGTTLAKGYHRDGFGHEWAEINGSEGSAVYRLHEPNTILLGKTGQDLAPVPVPAEFLKPAGSPRDPAEGAPATVFRYDLMWEFISAIVEGRPAVPSFYDGLNAQIVADAVLESHAARTWIDIHRSRLRRSRSVGRRTRAQYASAEMTSPPLTVPRARQIEPAHRALDEADAAVAEQDVDAAGVVAARRDRGEGRAAVLLADGDQVGVGDR